MSSTNKMKDSTRAAGKALAAVIRRKKEAISKRQAHMPGQTPGCWRAGMDQSIVSGLQVPRFTPGDPSPVTKNFQALEEASGKWQLINNNWAEIISKSCCGLLKEVARLKEALVASFWSNCSKCLTATPTVVPSGAALQENACCLFRACDTPSLSQAQIRPFLTILPTDAKTTPIARAKTTMVETDKGIQIRLNTSGYKRENITVEVEGNWLVIEAISTSTEDGGGYLQRHMMRRYELPPQADLSNITVELDESREQLRVTVPSIKPKVTFT